MRPAIRRGRAGVVALALSAFFALSAPALAAMVTFRTELTGLNEVPPNERRGQGTLAATFDTVSKKLTWTGTYSGLTGRPTGIHFHGPASPNDNAKAVLPIKSLFGGSATLSDAEADDLIAGYWYVDIHTRAYPAGEIRGQVMRGK
jgi:hypothetical protein